jgi:hypothetical protein
MEHLNGSYLGGCTARLGFSVALIGLGYSATEWATQLGLVTWFGSRFYKIFSFNDLILT